MEENTQKNPAGNKNLLVGVVVIIVIVAVVLVLSAGSFTGNVVNDCSYYCSQEGYGSPINSECISFTECNEPDMPVSAEICEGVSLCCCTI